MTQINEIGKVIDRLMPHYVEFLSNLIRHDSVYGNEKAAQDMIRGEMERLGLEVQTIKSRDDDQSINLAARILGAEGSAFQSLVLNAHADVVPIDAPERWSLQPFSGKVVDNVIYGRGAHDDKAGIATILLVTEALQSLSTPLKGDLILHSVIEEETTGNGTRAVIEQGYTGDGVIICDGAWPARIFFAHLGQLSIRIELDGDAVAASNERRVVNPIDRAMRFVDKLRAWIGELNAKAAPFEGIEAPFFVNLGSVRAGIWCGSVPARATMDLQLGFPDSVDADEMLAKVRAIASASDGPIRVEEWILKRNAYRGNPDAPLIRNLKQLVERNAREEVLITSVTGYTDMAFFGIDNICLYGPGGGKHSHGIDEHYFLNHMPLVSNNIATFAYEWCGTPR